ncbi:hypothetical protein SAMN04487775_1148 [Treponema bryantii]|uniref:Lipoprotein n=1 Tax=Treponema bryantii TaxID=163 RepID=A0A1I3NEW2_9SPIR|nr:hypothetical protein [Treponema bryantii]SFJ07470.1 hypothetical protein SAMN04487775_1148 [Treponema bryantii]
MKKTLKVLGLLAVAAALFVGCKQNVEEPGKKDIQGELFDPSDLTVTATKYVLSDGSWSYRYVYESGEDTMAEQVDFSISNGSWNAEAATTYISSAEMTIPEDATEEEKQEVIAMGMEINGNKATYYKEFDILALANKVNSDAEFRSKVLAYVEYISSSSHSSDFVPDPEAAAYVQTTSLLMGLPGADVEPGTKTNAEKSKYYFTDSETHNGKTYTTKIYLAKN